MADMTTRPFTPDMAALRKAWMLPDLRKPPTETYLIRCSSTGLVKIGTTKNVGARLTQLQLMCPTMLEVVATFNAGRDLERSLHQKYADRRAHGEWFALTDADIQEIRNDHS